MQSSPSPTAPDRPKLGVDVLYAAQSSETPESSLPRGLIKVRLGNHDDRQCTVRCQVCGNDQTVRPQVGCQPMGELVHRDLLPFTDRVTGHREGREDLIDKLERVSNLLPEEARRPARTNVQAKSGDFAGPTINLHRIARKRNFGIDVIHVHRTEHDVGPLSQSNGRQEKH